MFFIFISTVISWCSDIYSKQQYDRDGQLIATEPCLTPPFAWWWVVYFRLVNYYKHMQRLWVAGPLFAMYRPTSLQYLQALVSSNVLGSLPGSLPSEVGTAVYSMGPWNLFSSNIHSGGSCLALQIGGPIWFGADQPAGCPDGCFFVVLECQIRVAPFSRDPLSDNHSKDLQSIGPKKTCCFHAGGVLKVRMWFVKFIWKSRFALPAVLVKKPKPVVIESPVTWVWPWLHTVGRVWGACRGVPSSGPKFTISLAIMLGECEPRTLGGSFHPWGQRIPIPILGCMGCMTVRRCAKVLAGGVRRFLAGMLWGEAKHIVTSSHQVTMLIACTVRGWLCCCAAVRMNYRSVRGRCSFALFLRFCPMGFRT